VNHDARCQSFSETYDAKRRSQNTKRYPRAPVTTRATFPILLERHWKALDGEVRPSLQPTAFCRKDKEGLDHLLFKPLAISQIRSPRTCLSDFPVGRTGGPGLPVINSALRLCCSVCTINESRHNDIFWPSVLLRSLTTVMLAIVKAFVRRCPEYKYNICLGSSDFQYQNHRRHSALGVRVSETTVDTLLLIIAAPNVSR